MTGAAIVELIRQRGTEEIEQSFFVSGFGMAGTGICQRQQKRERQHSKRKPGSRSHKELPKASMIEAGHPC